MLALTERAVRSAHTGPSLVGVEEQVGLRVDVVPEVIGHSR